MTAARFILCACLCATELLVATSAALASPARCPERDFASRGALAVTVGRVRVAVGGGLNTNLPTLSVGAATGLSDGFDLALRYDTHAGIAHDIGVHGRAHLLPAWAVALDVTSSFYAFEEVAGIRAVDAPFGNGLSSTPRVLFSDFTAGGTHLFAGAGVNVRFVEVVDELGTARRRLALSARYARAIVGAEWPAGSGSTFLRFVANIPIETEAHVIGFFPWLVLGTTWELP